MNKERNSNIEILRIISMIMIIGHHYILYGVMQSYDMSLTNIIYNQGLYINRIIAQLLIPGGVVGVGIFFSISGYYGIQSDKVRIRSIIIETLVYSIIGMLIYLVLGLFNIVKLDNIWEKIVLCINPISNSAYWFVSVYILLMLIKPVLNQYIRKVKKYNMIRVLVLLMFYYLLARYNSAQYLGLLNGVLFYYLGAMIKIKEDRVLKIKNQFFWFVIGIVSWLLYVVFNNISWFGYKRIVGLFSLLGICIWGTVCVYSCLNFSILSRKFSNEIINSIASTTFSVYLIHEHPLLREILWSKILHVETIQWKSSMFALYAIISISIVFVGGSIIGCLKKRIFR